MNCKRCGKVIEDHEPHHELQNVRYESDLQTTDYPEMTVCTGCYQFMVGTSLYNV